MNLQELLAQPLQERDAIVARLVDDREIARDDVRAVAAAKAIRQRTPAMKTVTVVVDSVEDRDDNCSGAMSGCLTDVYLVTITASSTGGDWSSRRIEAVIPMIVSVSPYGEIGIECDRDRESECALRSTGRTGDDEMIDLPTFGSWLQHAAGKSLLREWLMWHGVSELVASTPADEPLPYMGRQDIIPNRRKLMDRFETAKHIVHELLRSNVITADHIGSAALSYVSSLCSNSQMQPATTILAIANVVSDLSILPEKEECPHCGQATLSPCQDTHGGPDFRACLNCDSTFPE